MDLLAALRAWWTMRRERRQRLLAWQELARLASRQRPAPLRHKAVDAQAFLHLLQHTVKIPGFLLRSKE